MKTLLKYLLVLTCASCDLFDLKEPAPKTELEKLPPITQEGRNTFGCLVNGKSFIPNNTLFMSAIYQGGGVQLSGSIDNNNLNQNILIITLDPLEINVEYNLTSLPANKSMFSNILQDVSCTYEFENTFEGSITFSKIDRINYIISGTFEFSTVTQLCDTLRITNGRFDMQYIP